MLLVMCFYAILAVELFGKHGLGGSYVNILGNNVTLVTFRGLSYGEEYYGNFARALFTLFQALTGESWAESIARPAVFSDGTSATSGGLAGIFYVTFMGICSIILINVVVAVLLDTMMAGITEPEPIDRIAMATEIFRALDVEYR